MVTLLVARRNEVAHVFNQAEDGHIDLLKHRCGLARVDQRHLLRGSDDNRAIQRNRLHDGKLDVARAWRQIEYEDVELAPFDLAQELLGVTRYHRSAQNRRRAVVEEKPHGH